MSRGRRAPHPAVPGGSGPIPVVGGTNDPPLTPPSAILLSTDPDEAPPPPPSIEMDEETRRVIGELEEIEDEEDALSPEEQIMFASLTTCGRRSKTVTIFDHTVVVQSINCDDDLRVGLFSKQFEDTISAQLSYRIAVAAAAIRTIDSKPLVQGLFQDADPDDLFDQKVAIVRKMYPATVTKIYRAALEAEKEFMELAARLGKSDG